MKATRQAFGEVLVELGAEFPHIVVLDADLAKSTKSELFAKKFPERFYEMGIAEANMIGTAAGLSFTGALPFLCSFGCFLTGRYDTIRLSVAYSQANVRLIGTHAGIGIGDDGYSQMALEDIALMRALPTMGVFQPMDTFETRALLRELVTSWTGPAYVRLTRQNLPDLFPKDAAFQLGKLLGIRTFDTPHVLCLATGATVTEALQASDHLKDLGVSVSVWNVHSLKPFDGKTLSQLLKGVKLVVTVEDHSVIGGLGSCAAEVLAEVGHAPSLLRLGIQDVFAESGDAQALYEKYGISAQAISRQIQEKLKTL